MLNERLRFCVECRVIFASFKLEGKDDILISLLVRALFFNNIEKMQAVSLYWFAAQQETRTLRRQKIRLFDAKTSADFNEFSLLFLKATESVQKMAKTKVVQKNAN